MGRSASEVDIGFWASRPGDTSVSGNISVRTLYYKHSLYENCAMEKEPRFRANHGNVGNMEARGLDSLPNAKGGQPAKHIRKDIL